MKKEYETQTDILSLRNNFKTTNPSSFLEPKQPQENYFSKENIEKSSNEIKKICEKFKFPKKLVDYAVNEYRTGAMNQKSILEK